MVDDVVKSKNQRIKDGVFLLEKYIPFQFPATAWFYSTKVSEKALIPEKNVWNCVYKFFEELSEGRTICFSAENPGCRGAANYLGFCSPSSGAPHMLVEKERFKKNIEFGRAFYDSINAIISKHNFIALSKVETLGEQETPEVITLWVNPNSLSGLITLANYDRATNNNVLIPFASGCQSIFTIPYQEKFLELPRCVVGSIDPAVRGQMSGNTLSFSVPTDRFLEMINNISGSFLELVTWKGIIDSQ